MARMFTARSLPTVRPRLSLLMQMIAASKKMWLSVIPATSTFKIKIRQIEFRAQRRYPGIGHAPAGNGTHNGSRHGET